MEDTRKNMDGSLRSPTASPSPESLASFRAFLAHRAKTNKESLALWKGRSGEEAWNKYQQHWGAVAALDGMLSAFDAVMRGKALQ